MKECAYCGRENSDEATRCRECGTDEFKVVASAHPQAEPVTPASDSESTKLEFTTPTPREMEQDLVTLIRCRTLLDADMIVARLESAGISAFIPDEFLMQSIGWNLNTFGYVRLQVSPKDFEAAKEFLLAPGPDA